MRGHYIFNRLGLQLLTCISLMTVSCTEFLDQKSSSAFAIPETLKDLRAMLDNESQINRYAPSLLEMGSDDVYVRPEVLKARPEAEQLIYTWERSAFRSEIASWNLPYRTIMWCNVVLESLARGVDGTAAQQDMIRGEALFVRAYAYLALAQIYCNPFEEVTSSTTLGLPLRTSSDFNISIPRATIKETYNLIVEDLKQAATMLPESTSFATRPTKAAAYGALARTYLYMGLYREANAAAQSALAIKDDLLDYNTLNSALAFPFDVFHAEIIYHAYTTQGLLMAASRAFIPKDLFDSFDERDLRKKLFFNQSAAGDIIFKGNYGGRAASYFAGICTDELYLIRAECETRIGSLPEAIRLLNALGEKRWEREYFTPFVASNQDEVLHKVLEERRKQLLRRGLRWADLRRLNKEAQFAVTLTREEAFQGTVENYELLPNAVQYTYPIPMPIMEWNVYVQNPI